MAATPFIITTAGMAAASTAGSGGPKIDITQFKIGSGVNYTPLASHTGLNGSTLYTGDIRSATPYNNDTMDIIIQMPGSVGPFEFGEIALYMPGNVMFAKCAYTTLQSKLSSAATGVGSVWTIHALIKLADASALFNFTYNTITSIPIVTGSALTTPDSISATCNAVLAMDAFARITSGPLFPHLMLRLNSTRWIPVGAAFVGSTPFTAVTTNTVTDEIFEDTGAANQSTPNYRYMIVRNDTGQMVMVTTRNSSGVATLQRSVSWLNTTTTFSIYDVSKSTLYQANLIGPSFCNSPPPADDNSTRLITSAWYVGQKASAVPLMDGVAAIGSSLEWAAANHRHPTDSTRAPIDSPTFGGVARYNADGKGAQEIGFRGVPLDTNSPLFLQTWHNGRSIWNCAQSNGGSGVLAVPGTVAWTPGFSFMVVNNCSNGTDIVKLQGSDGVTFRIAGTTVVGGSMYLQPHAMVSCMIVNGGKNVWVSGAGVSPNP